MQIQLDLYESLDISRDEALAALIQQFNDDMETIIGCYLSDLEAAPDEQEMLSLETAEKMLEQAIRRDQEFIFAVIGPLIRDSQVDREALRAWFSNGFFVKAVVKYIRERFAIDLEST